MRLQDVTPGIGGEIAASFQGAHHELDAFAEVRDLRRGFVSWDLGVFRGYSTDSLRVARGLRIASPAFLAFTYTRIIVSQGDH